MKWFIAVILGLIRSTANAKYQFPNICSTTPKASSALPPLPPSFEAHIEANFVDRGFTKNVEEYFDQPNNRLAGVVTSHGVSQRHIMNYPPSQVHKVYDNKTCIVSQVHPTSRFNIFNFTQSGVNGTIGSVSDIFRLGANFGTVLVNDNATARGIPVNHYTSCVKNETAGKIFKVDWYFSKPDYNTALGTRQQIPVRCVLNGTALNPDSSVKHNYYHIYEFTFFRPNISKENEIMFEVPRGIFCRGMKDPPPTPAIPDQLSFGIEFTGRLMGQMNNLAYMAYVDYSFQLIKLTGSHVLNPALSRRYGLRRMSVIEDFQLGIEYYIDEEEGNCTVLPIPKPDFWSAFTDPNVIRMQHAQALFEPGWKNMFYQGNKTWRGLPVDVWTWVNVIDRRLHEVYFLKNDSQGRGGAGPPGMGNPGNTRYRQLVGVYVKLTLPAVIGDALGDADEHIHVYDYTPGHPGVNTFDVLTCYEKGHQYEQLEFLVKGDYDREVLGKKEQFSMAVLTAIAQAAGVSRTRVSNIHVLKSSKFDGFIAVEFDLLDPPKLATGSTLKKAISRKEAKTNLTTKVESGLMFHVKGPGGKDKVYQIKEESLAQRYIPDTTSTSGYSSGSMAGIGIGMLIIGAILGLIGAFIIYKRFDTSVPYEVSH